MHTDLVHSFPLIRIAIQWPLSHVLTLHTYISLSLAFAKLFVSLSIAVAGVEALDQALLATESRQVGNKAP